MLPLVEPLQPHRSPVEVFRALASLPHCLFLDSARPDEELGRYSFVAADPFRFLQFPADGSDALHKLHRAIAPLAVESRPDLPPFQGGAAGLFGYDLGRSLEKVPRPRYDEFSVPALAVGLYDVVVAFDHLSEEAWIFSQGWPETNDHKRKDRAARRLAAIREQLRLSPQAPRRIDTKKVATHELSPQFPVAAAASVTSNFSRETYLQCIRHAVEYIHAGDVFQVNLSQRLLQSASEDAVPLYLRLRERNPAPFAAYFDLGDFQIVSASPERFVQVRNREVEARPIKGTRPRTALPEADLFAADDLLQSDKDRAENVMIVDLMRNDLSRVCRADSVHVTQLCRVEVYEFVQHLVSAVRGTLRDDMTVWDLLRAAFPGGSITGAPKVRAMEIIAELEPHTRGAYCGSVGYVGIDGSLDLSILIRTITAGRGWWQMPVGGGIVAQSDPVDEYKETWHKAKGLLEALNP